MQHKDHQVRSLFLHGLASLRAYTSAGVGGTADTNVGGRKPFRAVEVPSFGCECGVGQNTTRYASPAERISAFLVLYMYSFCLLDSSTLVWAPRIQMLVEAYRAMEVPCV